MDNATRAIYNFNKFWNPGCSMIDVNSVFERGWRNNDVILLFSYIRGESLRYRWSVYAARKIASIDICP